MILIRKSIYPFTYIHIIIQRYVLDTDGTIVLIIDEHFYIILLHYLDFLINVLHACLFLEYFYFQHALIRKWVQSKTKAINYRLFYEVKVPISDRCSMI